MSRSDASSAERQRNADIVLRIAGVLSLIQSVIYAALYAAAISSHYCLFKISYWLNHKNIIGQMIYNRYLKGDCDDTDWHSHIHNVLKRDPLHYWTFASLGLNVLWFTLSVALLAKKQSKGVLGVWTLITTFVLASDVGLTTVFTIDTVNIFSEPLDTTSFLGWFISSFLPLIVASKGGVTLAINFVIVLYCLCLLFESQPKEVPQIEVSNENNRSNADNRHSMLNRPPIDAYGTETPNAPPQPPPFNPELLHRVSMLSAAAVRQRSEGINRSFVHKTTGPNGQQQSGSEPHIPAPDYYSTEENSTHRMPFPPKSALKSTRH